MKATVGSSAHVNTEKFSTCQHMFQRQLVERYWRVSVCTKLVDKYLRVSKAQQDVSAGVLCRFCVPEN